MKAAFIALAIVATQAHAVTNQELCMSWTKLAAAAHGLIAIDGNTERVEKFIKRPETKEPTRQAMIYAINMQHLKPDTFRVFAVTHCLSEIYVE